VLRIRKGSVLVASIQIQSVRAMQVIKRLDPCNNVAVNMPGF
jgi:hypothetical protein